MRPVHALLAAGGALLLAASVVMALKAFRVRNTFGPLPDPGSGPWACRYDELPVDKSCTTAADCTMVSQVRNDCGLTLHIGVAMKGRDDLLRRLPQVDPGEVNPCVVRWIVAEDCARTGGSLQGDCVPLSPDGPGQCLTRYVARP